MGKGCSRQVFAVAWFSTLLLLTASLHAGSYQVGVAPPTVKVTDAHGNGVSGVNVTFTVAGGSIVPASPATVGWPQRIR